MTGARQGRLVTLLLVAVAVGGCSGITDAPVAPRAPAAVPARAARTLVSGYAPDGIHMTMVDESDGVSYTLDMAERTITRNSDGQVLELSQSQTDSAATLFAGSVVSDPSIPGLESVAALGTPSGDCDGITVFCDAALPAGVMLLEPLPAPPKGHKGRGPLIRRSPRSATTTTASDGMTAQFFGDPCTNIINAALPKVIEYRGYRASFLKQGFLYSLVRVKNEIVRYVLPFGTKEAVGFSGAMSNYLTAQVAIGWLAGNWKTYNCANVDVVAGPYYHSGGTYTMTPSGGVWVCANETWHISWDGGETWEPISVRVCQFQT